MIKFYWTESLVLLCIDAKCCNKILVGIAIWFEKKIEKKGLVGKPLTRSTIFTCFCTFGFQNGAKECIV